MTLRSLSALSLLVAVSTFAGASSAAPEPPAPDPARPTLVAGTAESIAGMAKAGDDGAEWVLPGGSRITASPGAELRVLGVPQPVMLGGKRVPGYTVLVRSGLVRARVPASGKSAIVFSAPNKTNVLVTSGVASVVAGPDVAVANAEGASMVASAGASFRKLAPGMLEAVEGGATVRRALAATPATLHGSFVMVSYGEDSRLGEITWDAVPNANGYRVELRETASGRVVARTTADEPRIAPDFAKALPGRYTLSVASLDRTGLESEPVEQPVRVIGLTLPAGGYVDATGSVRFPIGASLTLSNVDGVEMTYGKAELFVPTPTALDLFLSEPRLVRFRMTGSELESPLWLVPRDARAHIEFGPKAPRWPGSPLEIRIRVEDKRGQAAPQFIEPKPRVLVGIERTSVKFTRQGQWLRGVLPAQSGKGPWVVRVEVEDQNGVALGRDFVEVVETPSDASKPGS